MRLSFAHAGCSKSALRTLGAVLLSIAASLALGQTDIRITARKITGPDLIHAPKLGDAYYYILVNWDVANAPAASDYYVRFKMANREALPICGARSVGSYQGRWGFTMPLDGKIPFSVQFDTSKTTGDIDYSNNLKQGTFTPVAPAASGLTYFAPRTLHARLDVTTTASYSSHIKRRLIYMSRPMNGTFQQVIDCTTQPAATVVQAKPYNNQLLLFEWGDTALHNFNASQQSTVTVKNVKLNVALINDTWTDFDGLTTAIKRYTKPEADIQSDDPLILAMVSETLPADYRNSMRPIDAARELFKATVRRLIYLHPAPARDAKTVLVDGRAECSGYSNLYAACLRAVGIPARMVTGWREGTDVWHCWSEAYFPSVGWIPQDVTDSDGYDDAGDYAYCFGVVNTMNARIAVNRHSTHVLPEFSWGWGPQAFYSYSWYSGYAPNWQYTNHCYLNP